MRCGRKLRETDYHFLPQSTLFFLVYFPFLQLPPPNIKLLEALFITDKVRSMLHVGTFQLVAKLEQVILFSVCNILRFTSGLTSLISHVMHK